MRWDSGSTTATELGDLGKLASGTSTLDNGTRAIAIDAHDTITGYAEKYAGTTDMGRRAVRWYANTTAANELGNLGTDASGKTTTAAYGINASGLIVGMAESYVDNTDLGSRAVLWGADGVAVDLNMLIDPTSGWTLTEAHGISDAGWVYGIGLYDPDGTGPITAYSRAFLIQVPEPTGLAAIVVGGVAVLRRRRVTL